MAVFGTCCSCLLCKLIQAFSTQGGGRYNLAAEDEPSRSVSTRMPRFFSRSAMFRAMTTGTPVSISWVVRYRFRSMLVASTRSMMTSGSSPRI